MPSRLRVGQQEALLDNLKKCERSDTSFRFGPFNRKASHELGEIFQALEIGFFGSYSTTSQKDIPEMVCLHVMHKQAEKLAKVLIALGVQSEKARVEKKAENKEPEKIQEKKEIKQDKPKKSKAKTEKKTSKGRWSHLKED